MTIISLKLFSVGLTLVDRPGLGLCFIVIVSLPFPLLVATSWLSLSSVRAPAASNPSQDTLVEDGHFVAVGHWLKLLHVISRFFQRLCHLQLYTYSVALFSVGSVGLKRTASCVCVIFAYWCCKLMASLTIVTVVLNGILLGITRIPFSRFVLPVPHSPICGPLVQGLVSMMEWRDNSTRLFLGQCIWVIRRAGKWAYYFVKINILDRE